MADGVSFQVVSNTARKVLADRSRRIRPAARWAVREAGRTTIRAARPAAPVLGDKTLSTHRQLQAYRRRGFDVSQAYATRPVPGLLRASIRSARVIHENFGGVLELRVSVRGQRVHLYAGKQEARYHYMAAGEAAAAADMDRIATRAFARAWGRA